MTRPLSRDPLGRAGRPETARDLDALQLVVDCVTTSADCDVAAIALLDDDELLVAATSGRADARARLDGARLALPDFADDRTGRARVGGIDLMLAPLRDDRGALRGALAVSPRGHHRPVDPHRSLTLYAGHAAGAVVSLLERRRLVDQVLLAETARQIVRAASEAPSLEQVFELARPALLEGLQARGMWIQTFDESGLDNGAVYSADGREIAFTETVYAIAYNTAQTLWEHQETLVLSTRRHTRLLSPAESRHVADFLEALDLESILFVPVGAGHRCLGNLVLTREADAPEWTETEAAAARDIGRDLGVAVQSVRAQERERRLVHDLEAQVTTLVASGATPSAAPPGTGPAPESGDPDVVRARAELRAASDAHEQTGRRRDAQARIIADAVALGHEPGHEALEVYRTLRSELRDAHLYWQVAFDAWREVSERGQRGG